MGTFTIEDPEVDFEVIDGGSEDPFDGLGDAVFSTFNTVVLGTTGESAEFAEFDISGFSVPPGEVITSAYLQVQLTNLQVGGLGVNFGENPDSLGVYGYVGNGIAEASDFEAGTLLNTLDISSASVGDILTFDVSAFAQDLVTNGESFVGLGVRAQDFGGLAIEESSTVGVPSLTITTAVPSDGELILGTPGADTLIGEGGNDTLIGASGDDTLIGNNGDDQLRGDAGEDLLFGDAGNDTLFGGKGNDTLFGGKGEDFLEGGAGDDLLFGGRGADQFVLRPGRGTDTIFDYQDGKDSFLLAAGLEFEELTITQGSGNQTLIALDDPKELLASLIGVQANVIGLEDFTTLV